MARRSLRNVFFILSKMKLHIPAQSAPTSSSSPSNPRKLRKVLDDIPSSNMGEMTRHIYEILRDQNRQQMPVKERLENLEMIRVYTADILDRLKKYFINRTLPLPEKSRKIVDLNQSILQEMVYGYEIIVSEADDGSRVDDKTLSTAIARAIGYLSEILLRCSEVYSLVPKYLWSDTHQLYLFAEQRGLTDKKVSDSENATETTISNSYRRIVMFALARPFALRQSDCDRVYSALIDWCHHTEILRDVSEDMIDKVFSMRMHEDIAPDYLDSSDLSEDIMIRAVDARRLVEHLKTLHQEASKKKLVVGDELPAETLEMLIHAWSDNAARRFTRASREGHINVAIGLARICDAIRESMIERLQTSRPKAGFFNNAVVDDLDLSSSSRAFFGGGDNNKDLTLQEIESDRNHDKFAAIGSTEENAWDLVGRGRALTDNYFKQHDLIDKEAVDDKLKHSDTHWDIVNISAGGYCLRWNSDQPSSAQIGEMIALQEFDRTGGFTWHVGVIRWMQFTEQDKLEIGVQILSPKLEIATAQRAKRLDETPFDCLKLPEIKAIKQCESLLLPAHAFEPDNRLVIRVDEEVFSVRLGEVKEHTGSFTQFAYADIEVDKDLQKRLDEQIRKNQFDEIWSSL